MQIFRPPFPVPASAFSHSLFVAGGITGAPDWQSEFIAGLENTTLNVLNPRRSEYNSLDPDALREQIRWEHDGLRGASAISFWFPKEAPCLITLYELGSWSHWRDENGRPKPIFVGAHPEYVRLENVIIQTELERPEVEVVDSPERLLAQILAWEKSVRPL